MAAASCRGHGAAGALAGCGRQGAGARTIALAGTDCITATGARPVRCAIVRCAQPESAAGRWWRAGGLACHAGQGDRPSGSSECSADCTESAVCRCRLYRTSGAPCT
ncbi:hypothetical protein SteCoe_39606 [Stentor coeruleus]|uniref:Uncharacterized protein n=1 Tax=Stentor coeruleus TaxID=5963 RepID=A0A1R2AKM4_9CILI|nr:hypothetical protein SteCoe_39606 [Stentor coeruleus]